MKPTIKTLKEGRKLLIEVVKAFEPKDKIKLIYVDEKGQIFTPHKFKSGYYQVARKGKSSNKRINAIKIREENLLDYFMKDYLFRMSDINNKNTLVHPIIKIEG